MSMIIKIVDDNLYNHKKEKKRYITLCHLHKIIKMIYKVFVCFNFSKPFKCGMLAHTYEYIYIYIYIYI